MKLLIPDPNYPNSGEIDEAFREQLERELQSEFGQVDLTNVDAGPGAAEPAYFLQISGHAADIISLVIAVPVLLHWLPKWKEQFDRVASFLSRKKLTFEGTKWPDSDLQRRGSRSTWKKQRGRQVRRPGVVGCA
jgi:hypothetical protein